MRLRSAAVLLAIALGTALLATGAHAGDPRAGRYSAQTCLGCHGTPSATNVYPTYHVPRLGGQNAQYIIDSLQAYRDGDRAHAAMQAQARSLSDEEIADIAAFFANAEPPR